MSSAENSIRALAGKWYGHYGTAPCPICQPEARQDQNALSLSDTDDGRLLAYCHKSNCDFHSIKNAIGFARGYSEQIVRQPHETHTFEARSEAVDRSAMARRTWLESSAIEGTLAEDYLRSRAIRCDLPNTLRFHPNCWHGPTGRHYPAMIARIDGSDAFGTHRTYLANAHIGKAQIENNKLMLGASRSGAVRLADQPARLAVAEGIETALSLLCGVLDEPASVWAALSTSGISGLQLPTDAGRLTIAPDGDVAGKKAAYELAERASALGWKVDLLIPPEGHDWNDVLRMEAAK